VHVPAANPAAVAHLPPAVHLAYVSAFADALQPVFLAAAGVSVVAFALSWLLREIPLRKSAAAEGVAESFAVPRRAESLPEMERMLVTLAQRENRWRVYQQLAERAGVDLAPGEMWLLSRLGESVPLDVAAPDLAPAHASLSSRGLVEDTRLSPTGAVVYTKVVEARGDGLAELLDGWDPAEHDELKRLVDRLARELISEIPPPESRRTAA
jgi:hypothetical protein